jgi:hypothetical protein
MLYFALIRSKLEYASVAWNSVTITDFNKFELIQKKICSPWSQRIFQDVEYHYGNILEKLYLQRNQGEAPLVGCAREESKE